MVAVQTNRRLLRFNLSANKNDPEGEVPSGSFSVKLLDTHREEVSNDA
jgi:hypothetical protein